MENNFSKNKLLKQYSDISQLINELMKEKVIKIETNYIDEGKIILKNKLENKTKITRYESNQFNEKLIERLSTNDFLIKIFELFNFDSYFLFLIKEKKGKIP
jgi:hypothetical protein